MWIAEYLKIFWCILLIKVDTKSKLFIGLFLVLIVASGCWKYYKFFIIRDYVVVTTISCDPSLESCFVLECEDDSEGCEPVPYKKMDTYAYLTPPCDPYTNQACPEPVCVEGGEECTVTLCSEKNLEEGEMCVLQTSNNRDGELEEESADQITELNETPI